MLAQNQPHAAKMKDFDKKSKKSRVQSSHGDTKKWRNRAKSYALNKAKVDDWIGETVKN